METPPEDKVSPEYGADEKGEAAEHASEHRAERYL